MQPKADIGLIGLGVMGQNLVLNMNDHNFLVAVYNRTASTTEGFMDGEAKETEIIGTYSVEELVSHLKRPRRVMIMVKAGKPVDMVIEQHVNQFAAGRQNPPARIRSNRFMVSGEAKAGVVQTVLEDPQSHLPAQRIRPTPGQLTWNLDAPAAKFVAQAGSFQADE
ncbi:MAG: 6-phosphogluconate dehydrogenase, decarboxylating [Chloroflexi bacterium]|nr:6-phosphogluconate dehydrogenase, decarboxylating [Chloroflexota bacterium]